MGKPIAARRYISRKMCVLVPTVCHISIDCLKLDDFIALFSSPNRSFKSTSNLFSLLVAAIADISLGFTSLASTIFLYNSLKEDLLLTKYIILLFLSNSFCIVEIIVSLLIAIYRFGFTYSHVFLKSKIYHLFFSKYFLTGSGVPVMHIIFLPDFATYSIKFNNKKEEFA